MTDKATHNGMDLSHMALRASITMMIYIIRHLSNNVILGGIGYQIL